MTETQFPHFLGRCDECLGGGGGGSLGEVGRRASWEKQVKGSRVLTEPLTSLGA
jgi:hypothetical protein